jgi:xylose isomerase
MTDRFFSTDRIRYEGPDSAAPLAFRWYDADRVVLGKSMADHLRFAVCYWHSFCWPGVDMFGGETLDRPWFGTGDPMALAATKADAAFALFSALGRSVLSFHDRDVAPRPIRSRRRTHSSTASSICSPGTWRARVCDCCGARRISSAIAATRLGRRRIRIRKCSPTPPPR